MSKPCPNSDSEVQHAPDLLALQRRAAEQGLTIQLAMFDPDWELPEPVDLGGISVSDMIVRCGAPEP
jgi:hypothetical protein